MADELIRCPSCDHALRLPAELAGRPVECPQCRTRFTAPVPERAVPAVRPVPDDGAGPAPDAAAAQWAAAALRAPAAILLALAGLAVLWDGLALSGLIAIRNDPKAYTDAVQREMDNNPDFKD